MVAGKDPMSAWLCSDIHLSALVQSAIVERIIAPDEADELWREMRRDNLYALHCRYGDLMPDKIKVERTSVEAPLDPVVIVHNIGCWNYQCSEFSDCDLTLAFVTMRLLDEHLRRQMGCEPDDYVSSNHWGINAWSQAIANNEGEGP